MQRIGTPHLNWSAEHAGLAADTLNLVELAARMSNIASYTADRVHGYAKYFGSLKNTPIIYKYKKQGSMSPRAPIQAICNSPY